MFWNKLWHTTASTTRYFSLCFVFFICFLSLCVVLCWRLQGQRENTRGSGNSGTGQLIGAGSEGMGVG